MKGALGRGPGVTVLDIVFVALSIAFFVLGAACVAVCRRLGEGVS